MWGALDPEAGADSACRHPEDSSQFSPLHLELSPDTVTQASVSFMDQGGESEKEYLHLGDGGDVRLGSRGHGPTLGGPRGLHSCRGSELLVSWVILDLGQSIGISASGSPDPKLSEKGQKCWGASFLRPTVLPSEGTPVSSGAPLQGSTVKGAPRLIPQWALTCCPLRTHATGGGWVAGSSCAGQDTAYGEVAVALSWSPHDGAPGAMMEMDVKQISWSLFFFY